MKIINKNLMKHIYSVLLFLFLCTPNSFSAGIVETKSISCHPANAVSLGQEKSGQLSFEATNLAVNNYRWVNSSNDTISRENTAKALPAGNYRLVVSGTDGKAADGSDTIYYYTLAAPDEIIVAPAVAHNDHWDADTLDCTGSITVNATGGTGNYQYAIYDRLERKNFPVQTLANRAAGTYTISVSDENGCVAKTVATIQNLNPTQTTITPGGDDPDKIDTIRVCYNTTTGGSVSPHNLDTFPVYAKYYNNYDTSVQFDTVQYYVVDSIRSMNDGYIIEYIDSIEYTDGKVLFNGYALGTRKFPFKLWKVTITNNRDTFMVYSKDNPSAKNGISFDSDGDNSYTPVLVDKMEKIAFSVVQRRYQDADTTFLYNDTVFYTPHNLASNIVALGWNGQAINPQMLPDSVATMVAGSMNISKLQAGFHVIYYWTAGGAGKRGAFEVIMPPSPVTVNFTNTNITCYGDRAGTFKATAEGSWHDYESFSGNDEVGEDGSKQDTKTDDFNFFNFSVTPFIMQNVKMTDVLSIDVKNLKAGIYTVTATDKVGCSRSQSIEITQPDLPPHIVFSDKEDASCPLAADGSVAASFVDGAKYPLSYAWNNGAAQEAITQLLPGKYILNVTDANGCMVKDSVVIGYLNEECAAARNRGQIYNIITPNGDGYNDYFDLTDFMEGYQMECHIYNEYGKLVGTLTEQNPKWDPRTDRTKPVTGTSSSYTAFIRLYQGNTTIVELGETFSVIYSK